MIEGPKGSRPESFSLTPEDVVNQH
jgi:hypothetical protein